LLNPPRFKSKGESNNLKYGLCAWKNHDWASNHNSQPMEDTHCVLLNLTGLENWSFFGVFDGHNGDEISTHLSKELINSILNSDQELFQILSNKVSSVEYENRLKNAISNGFLQLDKKMRSNSGSTACVCLISPNQIYLINCGDSRGFIVGDNNQIKITTKDHNPEDPSEKQRIKKAGGILKQFQISGKNYVSSSTAKSGLAVSRSFGDYYLKTNDQCEQIIIAEPDIFVYNRSFQDEFLVLATDGIWDKIKNEELKQFIHYRLSISNHLDDLCEEIVDISKNKVSFFHFSLYFQNSNKCLQFSSDNMTIIIVTLPGAPQIKLDEVEKDEKLNQELEIRIKGSLHNLLIMIENYKLLKSIIKNFAKIMILMIYSKLFLKNCVTNYHQVVAFIPSI